MKELTIAQMLLPRQVGDMYAFDGDFYLLCQVELNFVALVSLNDGDRWKNAQEVRDADDITADEWSHITGGSDYTDDGWVKIRVKSNAA
jgi:hypothetical protein